MGGPSPLINYRNSKKYSPNMTFFLRTGLAQSPINFFTVGSIASAQMR